MWSLVRDQLLDRLRDSGELNALAPQLEAEVRDGHVTPGLAAQRLVDAFLPDRTSTSLSRSARSRRASPPARCFELTTGTGAVADSR
jgi:hypothetical protein